MDEPVHDTEEIAPVASLVSSAPLLIKEKEEPRVNEILQQITKLQYEHGETFKNVDERLWTELNPLLDEFS